MQFRRLGSSGLKVSALGLGTNAFGKRAGYEASEQIIHSAIDSGVNFIDTANIYAGTESETIIGHALQGKRHNVVLATKAGLVKGPGMNERGSSRYHLLHELEESLRRLQTDHIDLYQIHTFDRDTPLEETLRTLEDMIRSGKVRYIGASNYYAWELMKSLGISEKLGLNRFISTQTSYSLADRTPENELVPMCLDQGVSIIPYFPLAGGILSGKYSSRDKSPAGSRAQTDPAFGRYLDDKLITLAEQLGHIANQLGCSTSTLSLAWLLHQPVVATVIVGATRAEQLQHNLDSLSVKLTPEIVVELDALTSTFREGKPFAMFRLP
ncbi:aldo/keto reductase [Paenibacillus eucommiae]|uniref:Aryl-alcohol dehydrogenase-like predicted oxidoreductase n=1 Tax=Paenibacillus eucommiae TaxID=1355755 RepID=A0ABS4J8C1_9BACL|nr:aldo/keto reductase [Paenibacillus eucommiae]MBP1996102.1 aryl-alcohol dehydrogenase-like predicted oxidoreductase [Paenibacillus eucommiae]